MNFEEEYSTLEVVVRWIAREDRMQRGLNKYKI